MNLDSLVKAVGVAVVTGGDIASVDIRRVYAGDRMSDLLNEVDDGTLVVTNLAHATLLRLVELMDVPALCLVNGAVPELAVVESFTACGAVMLASPYDLFETCGRLYEALQELAGS